VQLGGRALVTGTVVRGRFWLRACIVDHRTTEADVDALVGAVLEAATHAGPPPGVAEGPGVPRDARAP